MSAVRLLLCEAYPTVAVKEDLMIAQTITPPAYESAAASAAAVGQLVAQMFLAHPSLPVPDTEKEVVDTYTALAHVHSESGNAAAARTHAPPSQPALARGEECTVV